MTALLQAPALTVQAGLDLLDSGNNWLQDISGNLVSYSLTRDNTLTVHSSGSFVVAQAIQGGFQRVRPYMMLSGAGLANVRWDLGVYLLTTPVLELSQTPGTYTIEGYDLLYYLQNQIGDTYTVPAGQTYLNAVAEVIVQSGITGSRVLLDQSAAALTVPADLVWALTGDTGSAYGGGGGGSTTQYLNVVNDLLAAIAYLPLWADWEGNFRSLPYIPPASLAPEFTFDLTQMTGVQVSDPRQYTDELWQAINWWRYLNSAVSAPVEGAGQYTYINQGVGPSSVSAVERQVRSVVTVSAPDQATLEGIASQAVLTALQQVGELAVKVSPFPAGWHLDMFDYIDTAMLNNGQPLKVKVQSQGWTINSDASDGAQTWQIV